MLSTSADVLIGEQRRALSAAHAQVGQSHGGGHAKGNGEPGQAAADEAPDALNYSLIDDN